MSMPKRSFAHAAMIFFAPSSGGIGDGTRG
jgi:hypothetical protein